MATCYRQLALTAYEQQGPSNRAASQLLSLCPPPKVLPLTYARKAGSQRGLLRSRAGAASTDTVSDSREGNDYSRMSIELDAQAEGEYCMPGELTIDNQTNDKFTILELEVKDYPGLLRVVAWVLNGLELIVENATLKTDQDGIARNTFWLTDVGGRKLKNEVAELVAERVGDFVTYCTPDKQALSANQFRNGNILVDNQEDEKYTIVTFNEATEKGGNLLEVASAMTGVGVTIAEAVIQGCTQCGGPEMGEFNSAKGRLFKFWVTDRHGNKLDFARATSLLYVLGIVAGEKNGSIQAPNRHSMFGNSTS
ncbi:hypothetical protein WJX72_010186 [[Myrmecia] bisecta]|uniref:ACT domain-containing protein n=1 Tax=[Myrmecia] bisecta TaxID=41462 RepID=A0AAW1R985_9CHLO